MRILKTLCKLLALPLSLFKLIVVLSLLPITIIEKMLNGEFEEWNTKRKFFGKCIKEMIKALRTKGKFTSSTKHTYYNDDSCYTRLETIGFDFKNSKVKYTIKYSNSNDDKIITNV